MHFYYLNFCVDPAQGMLPSQSMFSNPPMELNPLSRPMINQTVNPLNNPTQQPPKSNFFIIFNCTFF